MNLEKMKEMIAEAFAKEEEREKNKRKEENKCNQKSTH